MPNRCDCEFEMRQCGNNRETAGHNNFVQTATFPWSIWLQTKMANYQPWQEEEGISPEDDIFSRRWTLTGRWLSLGRKVEWLGLEKASDLGDEPQRH